MDSQNLTVSSQNVAFWSLIRDNNGRITDKTESLAGAASNYVYTKRCSIDDLDAVVVLEVPQVWIS